MLLEIGKVITFERTFTKGDVSLFTKISKDEGRHHVNEDDKGRLVVQGLLTATLPTKIGGDHHVLARTMNFEFIRPVFTGDTIRCEAEIQKYERIKENRMVIHVTFRCWNQHHKTVLTGNFSGVIFDDSEERVKN